jgi:hypothetical protein
MMKNNKKEQPPGPHKFSDLFYNPVTYFGIGLALFMTVVEIFLFGIEFLTEGRNVYLGLLTYAVLPVFLIIGLLLIPAGVMWKHRRVAKGLVAARPKSFVVDLSIPQHRNALVVFIVGSSLLAVMTAIGSYKAFHYTESVQFCGVVCHDVMEPQYTAHSQSPHARVKCVECHIGGGADWYVRSKLSGVRQIYHTIKKDYPRPIPTPVHNLRPAAETCEQCHWPGKSFSSVEMRKMYYPAGDSEDENWFLRMLIHVGSDDTQKDGIHAHMYVDNEIYYAAEDERRQNITWVKTVDKDGKETVYISPDSLYKDGPPPPEVIRKMDCMDCHNRPSHHFNAPYEIVNAAFLRGDIDAGIPRAKERIMAALSADYASVEEAGKKIEESLTRYYQIRHAEYYQENKGRIDQLVKKTIEAYKMDFFPYMQARWDAYPDNIGHLWSPGCFRCHGGEHAAPDGKVITRDCAACHTIIEQGPPGALESGTTGVPFRHPFEDDGFWQEMNCTDCHSGN